MAEELKSPLLENNSLSPGGSPRPSLQLQGPAFSQLSEALSRPVLRTVIITVHYWTHLNSGEHLHVDLEISANDTVQNVITRVLETFCTNLSLSLCPEQYLLRFASKTGKPKTDIPKLDVKRLVIDTNFSRFALCEKAKDCVMKEKLEPLYNASTTVESLRPEEPRKKRFFCCFSSE